METIAIILETITYLHSALPSHKNRADVDYGVLEAS